MSNFRSKQELIAQKHLVIALKVAEKYQSVPIKLHKPSRDVHRSVYGSASGGVDYEFTTIAGIVRRSSC